MKLSEKQRKFTLMVAALIIWAYDQGYELTFGEAHRTKLQALFNALRKPALEQIAALIDRWFPEIASELRSMSGGVGVSTSLHMIRLAVDLNLFINGVYQTDTEAYRPLGEKWESMGGSWGGRFNRPDGNHFSLKHEGVR